MLITCCSDLHHAPSGHPTSDETPGWRARWAEVRGPKLRLGDMDELAQFSRRELGVLMGTDVDGNHDKGSCGVDTLIRDNTVFMHGRHLDPWVVRIARGFGLEWLGGRLLRVAECAWPNVDIAVTEFVRKRTGLGRHGTMKAYLSRGVKWLKKLNRKRKRRGLFPIKHLAFGHLHQLYRGTMEGFRFTCTGCCVNGQMNFVIVETKV